MSMTDRVCSMLPGQKCWQDGIIPFLGRPGTGHRHGLFPLKSLLSSKQVPQRLQYLLMAAWFPIWGCRGIIIICWMIIFQIVIIYQWKNVDKPMEKLWNKWWLTQWISGGFPWFSCLCLAWLRRPWLPASWPRDCWTFGLLLWEAAISSKKLLLLGETPQFSNY